MKHIKSNKYQARDLLASERNETYIEKLQSLSEVASSAGSKSKVLTLWGLARRAEDGQPETRSPGFQKYLHKSGTVLSGTRVETLIGFFYRTHSARKSFHYQKAGDPPAWRLIKSEREIILRHLTGGEKKM
ncbi:hypothetical protein EVAR_65733_1 [Eumeta japonica]|uniref:Uncharacterized protein n=1 Tax=Eumeta variegata TaxID=151549 RepID=A0A4C1ZWE3_EUMVA|nr:hypothetical protein EVAR_65733_1 [Eumeta japonica]